MATTYALTPGSTTVNENAGTVTFTVTRSGTLTAETIFASTTQNHGSTNSGDYAGISNQSVVFAANQTTATVTVSITNDSVVESDETYGLIVQRNTSDPITTFLAGSTFTIHDDDAVTPTTYAITPGSTTVNENAGTVTFTVTRSGGLPAETIFASTTQNQGSTNSGDYTGISNQNVAFSANQTSATVTVSIINNTVAESDETYGLIVQRNTSDPITTFLAGSTFTIHDDDAVTPTTYAITPGSTTVNENAGTVAFTITRSGGFPAETVFASTVQGSANGYSINSGDYATNVNNLAVAFASGQTTATVTVAVTNDSTPESDETFGFIVQRNATDLVSTHLASTNWTIHDDDAGPVVSYTVVANPNPVNENAGTVTFTITRSGSFPAETVFASTVQGSANGYSINSGDYATNVNNLAVAFASGQTTATVTVAVTNDSTPESDETFGFIVQRNSTDPIPTHLASTNFTIHDDDSAATPMTTTTGAYIPNLKLPFSAQLGPIKVSQEFGEGYFYPNGNPNPGASPGANDHGKIDSLHTADAYLYYAIDFAIPAGSAVLSEGTGVVVESRSSIQEDTVGAPDGFGNYVTIKYDNGAGGYFYATYMHLNGVSELSANTRVTPGQVIGYSGDTGGDITTNTHVPAHLHVTYGDASVPYNSDGDSASSDPQYNQHHVITMADGSLAANGSTAPVTFNVGSLQDGRIVTSDNDFGTSVPSATTQPQTLIGSGVNSVITVDGTTTPQQGIDYRHSEGAALSPTDIKAANQQYPDQYIGQTKFVIEYIGVTDGEGYLRPTEAGQLKDAGLQIVSVFEKSISGQPGMSDTDNGNYTNAWVQYFVPGQGAADAERAMNAAQKAGQQSGAIYFAIDLNPGEARSGISESAALAKIAEYFEEIETYFVQHVSPYDIGVYGAGDTLAKIAGDPLVNPKYTWLAGAPGWTDSSPSSTLAGHSTFTNWTIKQYDNGVTPVGDVPVDLDQTKGTSFGQWVPGDQSGSGTHLLLSAQGGIAVVSDSDTGKDLYQISQFGEIAFSGVSNVIVKALNGTDIAAGTVFFNGTDGDDHLDASSADKDIVATGGNGNDLLIGGLADDILNGGAGADQMSGGIGNDTYVVDNTGDVVTENAGEGIDTVQTTLASYFLSPNVENLTFTDNGTHSGTGNELNNVITGGGGNDKLIGGADNVMPVLGNLPGQTGQMGSEWHIVSSQDFTGDGKGDILWVRNTTGDASLWTMNDGALSTFYSATQGHMGPEWTSVGSGDFNRDGKADLVWTHAGNIAIWQMDGPNLTAFANPSGHMGPEWHVKGIGDFNGDGYSDIIWHSDTGAIADWSMSGTALGGFGISNGAIGTEWSLGSIGDFNGDGRDDLLWVRDTGDVQIWTMNGANYTAITNTGHMGTEWHVAGSGDFNMDGKTDLVWVSDSNDVQIWRMNGGDIAQIVIPSGHMGTEWKLQGVNDFTGDGRPDLLWVTADGKTSVWNMVGNGDFLAGGGGSDTFQFNALNETGKVITDFQAGAGGDVLDLHNIELAAGYAGNDGLRDGSLRLIQNGANTEVQIDAQFGEHHWVDAVTLQNVNAAALTHANFFF
jgi:hypothetical protein